MVKKLFCCVAGFSMLAAPFTIQGQAAPVLGAGTRVRLVTPALDAEQRTGRVVSVENDTIQFRADAFPVTRTLALSDITSMEVSAGRISSKRTFAIVGMGLGAVVGFIAGHHESGGHGGQFIGGGRKSATENSLLSAPIGAAFGGLAGWMLGRHRASEKWVPLRSADR